MAQGEDREQTPFDLKIARDTLLRNIEPLWDQLCSAVQVACGKAMHAYSIKCTTKINDQNSVIRVAHSKPPLPGQLETLDSMLEFRLDRNDKKLIARISQQFSGGAVLEPKEPPKVYAISADILAKRLVFKEGEESLSPTEVAEREVVERLLGMTR